VAAAHRDRRLLYAVAFLRAVATSTIGVTLGAYLARLDLRGAARFFERFDADEQSIALLFSGARVVNAVSHLGAA
jgi:hypothetical protein